MIHKGLTVEKWAQLSVSEQLANVGADIERTLRHKANNNPDGSWRAFERALELMDLTIADPANKDRLGELCKVRELLVDYFAGDNIYNSSDELWHRYFYFFAYYAAAEKGK